MRSDELQTVVIVDDERINRSVLAELLHTECRILLAKDGEAALLRIAAEAADISLVLLDVSMPGMDGYEVLRRLQADEVTSDIPVIFITGQTQEEDEEMGLRLGAVDYISKPIRPAIVQARVRNHLRFAAQRRELERLSQLDGLTGIANRRQFDKAFQRSFRRAKSIGEPLGVAMIDVDHFKQYNDHYGHMAGDEALRKVAATLALSANLPHYLIARYGGEEFVLVTHDADRFEELLEEIRQAVLNLKLLHDVSRTAPFLTISAGAVIGEADTGIQAGDLLQKADAMLYRAKVTGRNRVVISSGIDPDPTFGEESGYGEHVLRGS